MVKDRIICNNGENAERVMSMQTDPRPDDNQPADQESTPVKPPSKHSTAIQIVLGIVLALIVFVLIYFSSSPEIYFRYGWVAAFALIMLITYSLERRYQRRFKMFWKVFLISAGACLAVMIILLLTNAMPIGFLST